MYTSITTAENLEQALVTRIQALLLNQLGQTTEEINCHLYDTKLTIVIKNALTKPEQLLISGGYKDLVMSVRSSIEDVIRPKFKSLIEEVFKIKVVNLLFATHLEINSISVIALLDSESN